MDEKSPCLTLPDIIPYLHKKVKLQLIDGSSRTGCVYTIDPESLSIILFDNLLDQQQQIKLIMGHAIVNITLLDDQDYAPLANQLQQILTIKDQEVDKYDHQTVKQRKNRLVDWLGQSRIPFQLDGDGVCIVGIVMVNPPFDRDSCSSSNEIALRRVQNIIQNFLDSEEKMESG
ncbi:Gem-associated protein 6 [Trichoplax sp. H2]|uniref:AD domain-containing protein n=1 Tax=Trichoplax adhaerens TaxID=10228 RepID=B3S0W2_TRIAD|nr:hypothetical protein TRIADDRAFT_57190 [Trichoplax adhaerens]EDV24074.1 hypothetical protein TRIADDRAFT_57190 [Trichoplax adhaerens]RDD44296.1 Gem-associated protein 6 [Trichoplax sp. H2]|eukprot:XP_002113600.1 hypothetical protein TRIADDRAFT_57190 [Trichoplax adhaerens]